MGFTTITSGFILGNLIQVCYSYTMAFNFNLFQLLLLELKSIYKNLGLPPMCKVYVKIKLICCQYVAEREQ